MWYKNKVSELLGIQYPIIQGPFGGGLSSVALVAAVSNAGGLGGYGAYQMQPEEIRQLDADIKAATSKPYALNLWVNDIDPQDNYSTEDFEATKAIYKPFFDELGIPVPAQSAKAVSKFEQQVEVLLDVKPPVFSFVFGVPDPYIISECKKRGIKTVGAATTLDEAIALEAAGVDAIAASGLEAGGHRPSFIRTAEDSLTGTFVLIQQLARLIKKPIIAAGGIADGRGIVAAMALGASGAQIGTAFLACEESAATTTHRKVMASERSKYTTLTRSFTGRLGRGSESAISIATGNIPKVIPFPAQTLFISSLRKAAIEKGREDMITFWMGQIAPLVRPMPAATLMKTLIEETEAVINNTFKQSA